MSQQINLFNAELRKSGKVFSLLNMLQGLAAVLCVALLFYAYANYQSAQLEQQLQEAGKNLATEQSRLAQLAADYARQRAGLSLEQELKNLAAEEAAQRSIISALKNGVIGNTRGYSAYMQAFARQSVNGLWLTGFNIEGDATQMSISGAALSPDLVPGYILRLNNEAVMRGKTFDSLSMQLPKVDAGKQAPAYYLEFVLQSVASGDGENGGADKQ